VGEGKSQVKVCLRAKRRQTSCQLQTSESRTPTLRHLKHLLALLKDRLHHFLFRGLLHPAHSHRSGVADGADREEALKELQVASDAQSLPHFPCSA